MARKILTAEEQAKSAELLADLASAAEDHCAAEATAFAGLIEPRFTRKQVALALQAKEETFQNWNNRGQIELDANNSRVGTKWRLYSARDVLRLGLAVKLTELGFPASLLNRVMMQAEGIFTERGPYFSSSRPCHIIVLADGRMIGPEFGGEIDLRTLPAGNFIVVRLDTLIREALEPLGYSITFGTADDIRATIARLDEGVEK